MIKWLVFIVPFAGFSQSYAPEPGVLGSTAVHKDSSVITYWAEDLSLDRGYIDISNQSLGLASHGTVVDGEGEGEADGINVVSLGDGGVATYNFSVAIQNAVGSDFAVFENGFMDHYLELAFVEVSSDGQNYFRFPAVSEIQTDVQLTNFDTVNCRYIHNLAGKYRAEYGTPFDLDELAGTQGLDIEAVISIRIIDVVGSINPTYGTYDSNGTIINDPFPTPFASSGFDLDGLALLQPYILGSKTIKEKVRILPNPVTDVFTIKVNNFISYELLDAYGRVALTGTEDQVSTNGLSTGIYNLRVVTQSGVFVKVVNKL